MKLKFLFSLLIIASSVLAQTNIISTNPTAEAVMLGNYNPVTYKPATVINMPSQIADGLLAQISTDSLKSYLIKQASFYNRNTGSDTFSNVTGIGAARKWVYNKFQDFSAQNENRLITSYLQFDQNICGKGKHKNVFAVLPGMDTADKSIVIIEGHIDSRCEGVCDSLCIAEGIEDNGSGTALVMELARVMSKYTFNHTIVFLVTTGEEQGLYGANAFALYVKNKGISVKAVQNNDVIGGILCGETASPPTECAGIDDIDSTSVRIFSFGSTAANGFISPHKAYARFIKVQYLDEVDPKINVKMDIKIMTPEDRTGRGGDHIPFRQKGYNAVRLTAAHEHGNANSSDPNYTDRQHSTRDVLGVDTDNNGEIDSFFVDFNYLKRNAIINGTAAAMAAIGPLTPSFDIINDTLGLTINITSLPVYQKYKVSVRTDKNNYDLDRIYTFENSPSFRIPDIQKDSVYYTSIAVMDSNGVESLFTIEQRDTSYGNSYPNIIKDFLITNRDITFTITPNPAKDHAEILISMPRKTILLLNGYLLISDVIGRRIAKIPVMLSEKNNKITYVHKGIDGLYNCSLIINGKTRSTKQIIFSK